MRRGKETRMRENILNVKPLGMCLGVIRERKRNEMPPAKLNFVA